MSAPDPRSALLIRHAQAMKSGDLPAALFALQEVVQLEQRNAPIDRLGVVEIFAPLEPIKWLLKPLDLCPGAPALVAGYGFSGKTVALQSLAVSIASGQPAWGTYQLQRGRVLHIDYEQGARLTRERYQRLAAGMMVSPDELEGRLELISLPKAYLDSPGMESMLLELCAGVDLVIIDSLRASAPTVDENSSEVRKVLDMLTRVSESTGACFVVIHHARKPNQSTAGGAKMAIRGSGALFDACGSVLVLEATKGEPVRVTHEKARVTGITADDFQLTISDVEMDGNLRGGLVVTAEACAPAEQEQASKQATKLEARVLETVRAREGGYRSKNDIIAATGTNRNATLAAINNLLHAGQLIESGTGRKARIQCR